MSEGGNDYFLFVAMQKSFEERRGQLAELVDLCFSKSLSTEGIREIIDRHRLTDFYVGNYEFLRAACRNKVVTEEIIRCLLEYFPAAASATDNKGRSPLHYACGNEYVTLGIIQLLVDAAPNSVRSVDNNGHMPLHGISNKKEADAIEILKFLMEKCPEAVRHVDSRGELPIHLAARNLFSNFSPEYCRVLIEAYPGSERITNARGDMPLHSACIAYSHPTIKYLYSVYPDAINHSTTRGLYPIHIAIQRIIPSLGLVDPAISVDIVKFLLDSDPNVKLQKWHDVWSLLHFACRQNYHLNVDIGLEAIKVIFDAHPEAIAEKTYPITDIQFSHRQIQAFINSQLAYARQAKSRRLMTTPDDNGRLPLHTALQNNVRLGSIKLLVKRNVSALRTVENNLAMPLHIACEFHDSASVVQYLLSLDEAALDAVDRQGNTALHYACRGAKHGTIALLLEKCKAASVSKRNADGGLPIDVLWESSAVEDRASLEYTESVFRLLKAYPETLMNMINVQEHQLTSGSCPGLAGKKRKFGNEE